MDHNKFPTKKSGKGLGISLGFRYAVSTPGTVSHLERH